MALPPVCAGGLFHYTLLISLAVLQTALNVSCLGHWDSVSIIRVEAAAENRRLIASVHAGKGRGASSAQVDRALVCKGHRYVRKPRPSASHLMINYRRH